MPPVKHRARPSVKELSSKLTEAKNALRSMDGFFVDERKMVSDIIELGLVRPSEIWPLVRKALEEIEPQKYSGQHPPQKSYETIVLGKDCWQFTWESNHFGKRMFLRFMLMNGHYFHSSLHESRKAEPK